MMQPHPSARTGERLFNWHLKPRQPLPKRGDRNTDLARPLGHGHRLAFVGNDAVPPRVVVLLGPGRPGAVSRFITLAVVLAFKAVVGRRFLAHIGKEVLEPLPPFTDGYAARAVVGKTLVARLFAATAHVLPCEMFRRVGHSVLGESTNGFFCSEAPAGKSVTGSNVRAKPNYPGAAIALKNPVKLAARVLVGRFDSNQSSVTFPSHVNTRHYTDVVASNTNVKIWSAAC